MTAQQGVKERKEKDDEKRRKKTKRTKRVWKRTKGKKRKERTERRRRRRRRRTQGSHYHYLGLRRKVILGNNVIDDDLHGFRSPLSASVKHLGTDPAAASVCADLCRRDRCHNCNFELVVKRARVTLQQLASKKHIRNPKQVHAQPEPLNLLTTTHGTVINCPS